MEPQHAVLKEVTVTVFGGQKVQRVVVKDLGETVLVCKREELEAAARENREPLAVGIKKDHIEFHHNAKAR